MSELSMFRLVVILDSVTTGLTGKHGRRKHGLLLTLSLTRADRASARAARAGTQQKVCAAGRE